MFFAVFLAQKELICDKLCLRAGVDLGFFEARLFENKTFLHWLFLVIFLDPFCVGLGFDERRDKDISCLDLFGRSTKCSLFDGHTAMRLGLVALVLVFSWSWGFVLEGIGKSAD